jgi:hypothetical protein
MGTNREALHPRCHRWRPLQPSYDWDRTLNILRVRPPRPVRSDLIDASRNLLARS